MGEPNQTKWSGIRPTEPPENIPVDLKAQTGSNVNVDIAAQAAGNINVDLAEQSVGAIDVSQKSKLTDSISATGTGTDAFNASQDSGQLNYMVILIAESEGAIFQFSPNNSEWSADIIVPADVIIGFDFQFRYWKVKNRSAGNNVTYSIMGLF